MSELCRKVSTKFDICLKRNDTTRFKLLSKGLHVHSFPSAPPKHCVKIIDSGGHLPHMNDHLVLDLVSGISDEPLLTLRIKCPSDTTLKLEMTIVSLGGAGERGELTASVMRESETGKIETASGMIETKAIEQQDSKGAVLCEWTDFFNRTNNALKRYRLCAITRCVELRPFRETVVDQNGEMQHESLTATASNENSHKRLAGFSGRGRSEELGVGSMIAGDYIDSRNAAIRHTVPHCGADVLHDELQLAAEANKLAGYDGSGTGASDSLLPCRPYDYNLPRAAPAGFVLVKSVGRCNSFIKATERGHRRSNANPVLESEGNGLLALPKTTLRNQLPLDVSLNTSLPISGMPSVMKPLMLSMSTAAVSKTALKAWTAAAGCPCVDKRAHTSHVSKCRQWLCTCKPPATGKGGDTTHDPKCMRRQFQLHQIPFRTRKRGDRAQMLPEARRLGCADKIFDGSSWVDDANGRPIIHSAWVLPPVTQPEA